MVYVVGGGEAESGGVGTNRVLGCQKNLKVGTKYEENYFLKA